MQMINRTETCKSTPVKFKLLRKGAKIPTRATSQSAGFDLYAAADVVIRGGEGTVIIPTGVAVQLPPGTYGRIAARSGLAVIQHICVSGGVIDADYTGEVGVIAFTCRAGHIYTVRIGDRVAQLVVEKISYAAGIKVAALDAPDGEHVGFGSTGQ